MCACACIKDPYVPIKYGPQSPVLADPSSIAAKALTMMDEEVEKLPAYKVIRQADMQRFWGSTLKQDEVSWDSFWLSFPERLPRDAGISTNFASIPEREAFQAAVHVVGAPDYVTVAMIDAAYPPGCSIQESTARCALTLI